MEMTEVYGNIKDFIWILSYFPDYSLGNQLIILKKRPHARMLKTMKGWNKLDRRVDKNATAIPLIVPIDPEERADGPKKYRPAYFFDITQVTKRNNMARIINPDPYRLRERPFYQRLEEIFRNETEGSESRFSDPLINAAVAALRERIIEEVTEAEHNSTLKDFLSLTGACAVLKHYSREYEKEMEMAADIGLSMLRRYKKDDLRYFLSAISRSANGLIDETDFYLSQDEENKITMYKEEII